MTTVTTMDYFRWWGRALVHVVLAPLYVLILVQVWPIVLLFVAAVAVHLLEQLFPRSS